MMKTIRLYRQHDMDLISLWLNPDFDFTTEMKNAVKAVLHNKPYIVKIPEYAPRKGYLRRAVMLHITFADNDPDWEMINEAKKGQCNSFFKAAMRTCLDRFPYEAYFSGDGVMISRTEVDKAEAKAREEIARTRRKPGPKSANIVRFDDEDDVSKPASGKRAPIPAPAPEPVPEVKTAQTKSVEIDTSADDDLDLFNAILSKTSSRT